MTSETTTTEATAAAVTDPVPTMQSTQEAIISLPCALKYFFAYATTAWGYCRQQLALFFAESDRFTEEFIDDQLENIAEVRVLPDLKARLAAASAAREVLKAHRQQVGSMAKRLRTAIDYTYKNSAMAEIERRLAGLESFTTPSNENWGSVSEFIVSANNYLTLRSATLVAANAIKSTFPAQFTTTGEEFEAAWADFRLKEKTAVNGTKVLNDGLKSILLELNPMLEIGKQIFEFDATARKMFTTVDLVREVRSTQPAGVSGFVRLGSTEQPIAGVLVEVENYPEKTTMTDERGKYEIKLAEGVFNIHFSKADMQPMTILDRQLKAGVTSRLNINLAPAPVEVTTVEEEAAPAEAKSPFANGLTHAVSDILDKAKATKATNGELV